MNNLSLLIYASDLVQKIEIISMLCIVFPAIIIFICTIAFCFSDDVRINNKHCTWKEYYKHLKYQTFISIIIVSVIINLLMPSRTTVLMIAASEYSEKLLSSPKVQNIIDPAFDLLSKYIKNQLEEQTKPSK